MSNIEIIQKNIMGIFSRFRQSEILPKITKHYLVTETDGTFIQIGIAPVIKSYLFDPEEPELIGLDSYGFNVAQAEKEYLVKVIKSECQIIQLKKNEIFQKMLEAISNLVGKGIETDDEIVILVSDYLKWDLNQFYKELSFKWSHKKNSFVLAFNEYEFPVIYVKEESIGNSLIIYNKNSILCKTKEQENKYAGKSERLSISYKDNYNGPNTRFEIKTVIKIIIQDKLDITILNSKKD